MRFDIRKSVAAAVLMTVGAVSPSIAGGPLYIKDPASGTPYVWPAGTTPIYLDLGPLGPLSNEQAGAMVAFAAQQWTGVATASLEAAIAGDVSLVGLGDVDATSIFDVLGAWNGGGIHVVYDTDGSIFTALFGHPFVLGFAVVEWVDEDSAAILEATVVLNGAAIFDFVPPEEAAQMFAGVATHELGHAINLAHSQTNGQHVMFFEPYAGPEGCSPPFSDMPSSSQTETMFPFIDQFGTGAAQATVDFLDDVAAVSDLYPQAGWPASHATIRGTVRAPTHGPHGEEFVGANVIARNQADPWGDAISAMSGDHSQGLAGPDGDYAFHGLTPGASYSVYVDGILAGAFSTPVPVLLPGPEEYWNGDLESGDGITDERCASSPLSAPAGGMAVADITFNKVKGAPRFIPIEHPNSWFSDISRDGSVAVGGWAGGLLRWTPDTGAQHIGGSPFSPSPGVSENGLTIVGEITREDGIDVAAVWQGGESWAPIGTLPGSDSCDYNLISAWDASDSGSVVGLQWLGCTATTAYRSVIGSGVIEPLGFFGTGSRADAVSSDGSVVVGWDSHPVTGQWRGARWDNGVESLVELPQAENCDNDPSSIFYQVSHVGAVSAVTGDGSSMVGECYPVPREFDGFRYCDCAAWRSTPQGGIESLGPLPYPDYSIIATDLSDDGNIVTGVAWPFFFWDPRRTTLWTPWTGQMDIQEFLIGQGVFTPGWIILSGSVSGDGHTLAGGAAAPGGFHGYVLKMEKVLLCHTPAGKKGKKNTIDVALDAEVAEHLAHGDTLGMCGNGM
ncbi:MAG: hypothetical protein ACREAA_04570 [Candidatus Polarisedimenticolia bacterium]